MTNPNPFPTLWSLACTSVYTPQCKSQETHQKSFCTDCISLCRVLWDAKAPVHEPFMRYSHLTLFHCYHTWSVMPILPPRKRSPDRYRLLFCFRFPQKVIGFTVVWYLILKSNIATQQYFNIMQDVSTWRSLSTAGYKVRSIENDGLNRTGDIWWNNDSYIVEKCNHKWMAIIWKYNIKISLKIKLKACIVTDFSVYSKMGLQMAGRRSHW